MATCVSQLTPWVTPDQVQAAPGAQGDDAGDEGWLTPAVQAILPQICCAVSSILYRLTGRQFAQGGTATVRPAKINRDCGCLPWWTASWGGWGTAWSIWPFYAWPEGWSCGCPSQAELELPGPVDITAVVVDGATLTEGTDYVLVNKRRLIRMASVVSPPIPSSLPLWPCCQDMRIPLGQPGTWSVEYTWGKPVPDDGQLAAIILAVEFAKAFAGQDTQLPERVTTIARQGVTAIVMDPLTFIERGLTGLPIVDQFIISTNPIGLRRRPSISSPDTIALEEQPS